MTTATFSFGNFHARNKSARNTGMNWTAIWEACQGPVFRVVDEDGHNVADARIRHLSKEYWLYVDDTDGYEIMSENLMDSLILTEE